ncbi:MAG: hypothetical protein QOI93_5490 [Rhodospirillaceae bacterium]|nr:hypothetical protein [Rhodospirillaceae bacterium]
MENADLSKAIATSARLNGYDVRLSENHFAVFRGRPDERLLNQARKIEVRGVLAAQGVQGYARGYRQQAESAIPYLAPSIDNTSYVDAPMPYPIANMIEIFIIASLPYEPPVGWRKVTSLVLTLRWRGDERQREAAYHADVEVLDLGGWATVNGVPQASSNVKGLVRFAMTKN